MANVNLREILSTEKKKAGRKRAFSDADVDK